MPTGPTCLVTKSRQRPKLIGRRSRKAQRLRQLNSTSLFFFFLSQLRARSANIKISTIESDGVTNSVHKPHFLGDKSRGGKKWRTYRDVQKNHMLYIVSMLKSEGRLYCAGKRPHLLLLPAISFSPVRFFSGLWGNHITTPCFFHSLRGRDGEMEPVQPHQHPMQLNCNLSPLLLLPFSSSSSSVSPPPPNGFFSSCPSHHPPLTVLGSCPIVQW